MSASITIPVGVVVAREKVGHPWQDFAWRPIGILLNAPETETWRELRRDEASIHYHAATMPLELHRKDTASYQANLLSGEPAVYVVLRQDPGAVSGPPVSVQLVTASPYDAEAYGESGLETIERVPMPAPLIELVEEFVAVHHVEEPFVKRQRQKHHTQDEYKFGQEPIHVLRERMRMRRGSGDANG